MGLDLALGGLVLVMAIRGWLKGFVLQAIRLAGLVLCVYSADPVRDQLKPHVMIYLPTVRPELVDRMLWWISAVGSYIVLVGLASLAVKLYRRQPYGLDDENRADQFAGSVLGAAKGVVVCAFLVAGLQNCALEHLKPLPWVQEQVTTSQAIDWNARYHPSKQIWTASPVQHFVNHVQRMGLDPPAASSPKDTAEKPSKEPAVEPVQTASRTPKLQWSAPSPKKPESDASGIDSEVAEAIEAIRRGLLKTERPK